MGTNDVLGGLRHPLLCDVSCDVCFGNHKNRLFTPAHSGNSTKFVCNGLKKKNCLELTIKTNITTFQISRTVLTNVWLFVVKTLFCAFLVCSEGKNEAYNQGQIYVYSHKIFRALRSDILNLPLEFSKQNKLIQRTFTDGGS